MALVVLLLLPLDTVAVLELPYMPAVCSGLAVEFQGGVVSTSTSFGWHHEGYNSWQ
jgi:hypothetical protein